MRVPQISELGKDARHRVIYPTRLPINQNLQQLVNPHLSPLIDRPPKSGVKLRIIGLRYRARNWNKPRRRGLQDRVTSIKMRVDDDN